MCSADKPLRSKRELSRLPYYLSSVGFAGAHRRLLPRYGTSPTTSRCMIFSVTVSHYNNIVPTTQEERRRREERREQVSQALLIGSPPQLIDGTAGRALGVPRPISSHLFTLLSALSIYYLSTDISAFKKIPTPFATPFRSFYSYILRFINHQPSSQRTETGFPLPTTPSPLRATKAARTCTQRTATLETSRT